MKRNSVVISILATVLILSSCLRDIRESFDDIQDLNGIEWSPELAVPLIKSSLSLEDLVNRANTSLIEIDDENLIHLVYRGQALSATARDFYNIPNQTFQHAYQLSASDIGNFGTASDSLEITDQFLITYDGDIDEVDSILMSICLMFNTATSTIDADVDLDIEFPTITLDGQALRMRFSLANAQGGESKSAVNPNLTDYMLDFTKGPSKFNELPVNYRMVLKKPGSGILDASMGLTFDHGFQYNEYEVMYGYTSRDSAVTTEPDTVSIVVFENSNGGTFKIEDPRLKLNFCNSFGIPSEVSIFEFKSHNDAGTMDLTGLPSVFEIPFPSYSEIGEVKYDSLVLNKSTSNIGDMISSQPKKFTYLVNTVMNPASASGRNFITKHSKLNCDIDIDVPLHGSANDFALEKDFEFSFFDDSTSTGGETPTEIERIRLRLYLENEFPVDLDLQLYVLDDQGAILDSLLPPNELFLASGDVDGNGRVIAPTINTIDIDVDQEKLSRLENGKMLRITAGINTYKDGSGTQPSVKFYSDYDLFVKLGVAAKFLITTE